MFIRLRRSWTPRSHGRVGSRGRPGPTVAVLLLLAACAPAAAPLFAAKVSTWRHSTESDFQKNALSDTVVTSGGRVVLARRLESLATPASAYVWDLAEDESGNLYAAVADPGKLLRIAPDGNVTTLWEDPEAQAFAVATAADDVVYVGTGPGGKVWKIAGESSEVYFDPQTDYVWDLALDQAGNLFVATGPEGKIFRVDAAGSSTLFYDAKQKHVLCLALGENGTVYAGTADGGLIYRISTDGKAFVLYETKENEVRSLLRVEGDVLYAGTGLPGSVGRTTSTSSSKSSSSSSTSSRSSNSSSRSSSSSSRSSSRSSAGSGKNALYRIAPDGMVREVFRRDVLFFGLLKQQDAILAATGTSGGIVYAVDPDTGEQSQYARVDSEQVLCLLERKNGSVVFGTGNPGGLYTLASGYCASGTVTSQALDAGMISRWGAVRWEADVPEGTSLSLAVRSGNVAEPGETWSDWSTEMTEAASAAIPCPAARFLQYRATLGSVDPERSPELLSVTVRYQTTNQAPEISGVKVPQIDQADGTKKQEKYKLTWTAKDTNKDTLRYRVAFRKQDWKNWIEMADDLTKAEHEWDTTAVPEGTYLVRVTASDAEDNPPSEALTAIGTSEPFLVDHSPPAVAIQVTGTTDGQTELNLEINDNLTRLCRASYSLDSGPWQNLFPTDGLFDTRREAFRFRTEDLKPGTHVLVVQAVDAAGNTGTADAVFETK